MTVVEAPRAMLHKNLPVEIKVVDDEKGIVEAFVAGIGNKDSSGDIIQPGAFDDSLKSRTPKGVWSHDWSIWVSKTISAEQCLPGDPRLPFKMASKGVGGLLIKMQFNLETQAGKDAYSNVKFFGDEAEWSIGYMEVESEFSKDLQANLLHKIDLYEYSPVLFGANSLTSTVSVKITGSAKEFVVEVQGLEDKTMEAQVSKAVKETLANAAPEESDGTPAEEPQEKVVPGSMEARYAAVSTALSAEHADGYTFPVATFTDSVVYELFSFASEGESGTFQRSYSIDETGEVVLGEPKAVDIVEVIVEKLGALDTLEEKGIELEALEAAIADSSKTLHESLVAKAGRVLSTKNRDRLEQAKSLIDEVMSSAEKASDDDKDETGEKEVPVDASTKGAEETEEVKGAQTSGDDYGVHPYESGGADETCKACGMSNDAGMHAEKAADEPEGDEVIPEEKASDSEEIVALSAAVDEAIAAISVAAAAGDTDQVKGLVEAAAAATAALDAAKAAEKSETAESTESEAWLLSLQAELADVDGFLAE